MGGLRRARSVCVSLSAFSFVTAMYTLSLLKDILDGGRKSGVGNHDGERWFGHVDAAMTQSHSTLTSRRIEPALGQRT